MVFGQSNDPVAFRINGRDIHRSEFLYSYNQYAQSSAAEKSIEQYIGPFVKFQLKVEAALQARLDTIERLAEHVAPMQTRHIVDEELEAEAHRYYQQLRQRVETKGGLVKPAQILLRLEQRANKGRIADVRRRIDSIYTALKGGADFAMLAKHYSDDLSTARNGGELPWIERGTVLKELEDAAFALRKGEMSRPFESPEGYHIILLKDRCGFLPYDSLREDILTYVDMKKLREKILQPKLNPVVGKEKAYTNTDRGENNKTGVEIALERLAQKMYREELLAYEICNRMVWTPATTDEVGLERYFKKNKKRYRWSVPYFRGAVLQARSKKDLKAAKKALKAWDYEKWDELIRSTFDQETEKRILVRHGLYRQGDDAVVDNMIFKTGGELQRHQELPYMDVYGKKLKAPKSVNEVKSLALADYQESLEEEWVESLRHIYKVEIFREAILKTEN